MDVDVVAALLLKTGTKIEAYSIRPMRLRECPDFVKPSTPGCFNTSTEQSRCDPSLSMVFSYGHPHNPGPPIFEKETGRSDDGSLTLGNIKVAARSNVRPVYVIKIAIQ